MEVQNCHEKAEQSGLNDGQVAVVMVPLLAQGHLNQLLHLSHLLASYTEIQTIHYVGTTIHNRQAKLRLQGWNLQEEICSSKIHFHDFKLPTNFSSPDPPEPNANATTNFPAQLHPVFDAALHLRQPMCQLLQELASKFRRIVVINDSTMASVVQDVKSVPNAEAYDFVPTSAFTIFAGIWGMLTEKPFQLDSGVPSCIPSLEGCYTPEVLDFLHQRKISDFQSGALYNTCRPLEGIYVELMERLYANLKHFAIGPFNPVTKIARSKKGRHECLEWLDKREKDSVIYVSFGSTTTLSGEQIKELAQGLERSGQNFIWVLRNADRADIFAEDEAKRVPQLPERYEEKVEGRGLVIRDWAPQLEILAHSSTGGFMSHCGWNSCLESITMGVPIAAWPMHSDQPRNSVLVTAVLKIGALVRDWDNRKKLVASSTIENVVRELMRSSEGEKMRKRATELSQQVQESAATGGASHQEMEAFISHITR